MTYEYNTPPRRRRKRLLFVIIGLIALIVVAGALAVRQVYTINLGPVSSSTRQTIVSIDPDASVKQIAADLESKGLIREGWAFEWYVKHTGLGTKLQAGSYKFSQSQSTADIARTIASGRVAIDLVTILPGSRLSQIREAFIRAKFDPAAVDAALKIEKYAGNPVLAEVPAGATLEGYLYPDSYQKDATTDPSAIVEKSLTEMQSRLTTDLRQAYARRGISVFEAVTLASIVEQEVSKQSDRAQAAQVFLKRLSINMQLGSDVTAFYGSVNAGLKPSLTYDSPYNTLLHKGLPPGPISNVSASSLDAVARPAATDWLFFVAGDNGNTYFSKTLAEHDALAKQYCKKLCNL